MATVRKWVVDLKVYGIKEGVCEFKLKPGDALEKMRGARKNEFWWVPSRGGSDRERKVLPKEGHERHRVCLVT